MCRNIRPLHNYEPASTEQDAHDAALQYVRKVSGTTKPPLADQAAFERAVDEVAASTRKLLASLLAGGRVRTREGERERARARWTQRETRIRG